LQRCRAAWFFEWRAIKGTTAKQPYAIGNQGPEERLKCKDRTLTDQAGCGPKVAP
jgi:hypothetical protein